MRYLWLTRWAPYRPLNAGDIVYSRSFIESLAEIAPVDALVFEAQGVSPPERPGITWHQIAYKQAGKIASLASRLPNVANRHDVPAYLAAMRQLAEKADVVIVDHLGLAFCVEALRRHFTGASRQPVIILINHNYETALRRSLVASARNPAMRLAFAWDGLKAARLEKRANNLADGFTAITTTDLEAFRKLAPRTQGLLAMPGYAGQKTETRQITAEVPPRVCIVGGRGPFHKQLVLTRMLDALVASGLQNSLIVDVVGGGLDHKVEAVRARYPGVNFLGFVEDIQEYFATARLGLIPDEFGGGFKIRALSHIFMRLPMLALPPALAGMGLRQDIDFASAPSIPAMVDAIPGLIADFDRLNAIQNAAYQAARTNFDWAVRARALDTFAKGLAEKGGALHAKASAVLSPAE